MSTAITTSVNVGTLISVLISRNTTEAMKFFAEFIKRSFNRSYIVTHQIKKHEEILFDAINSLVKDEEEEKRDKLIESLYHVKYIDPTPCASSINASFLYTITSFNDLILFLESAGKINIINNINCKNTETVIRIPIEYNGESYKSLPSVSGKKEYLEKWRTILQKSEVEECDPLKLLPLINGEKSDDELLNSEEFTIYCLKSIIRDMKEEINSFNFSTKLAMIKRDALRYEKLIDLSMLNATFDITLSANSLSDKLLTSNTFANFSEQIIKKRSANAEIPDLLYPLFITKLNKGITRLQPSIAKILDEFDRKKLEFEPESTLDILEDEISMIHSKLLLLKDADLGDQFIILSEAGENLKTLNQILDESNIEYSQEDLFKQVFAKDVQRYVINAVCIFGQIDQQMAEKRVDKELAHIVDEMYSTIKKFIMPNLLSSYTDDQSFLIELQKTIANVN